MKKQPPSFLAEWAAEERSLQARGFLMLSRDEYLRISGYYFEKMEIRLREIIKKRPEGFETIQHKYFYGKDDRQWHYEGAAQGICGTLESALSWFDLSIDFATCQPHK